MKPGKLTAQGLQILAGDRENQHLTHEVAVLRDCLEIAVAELAFQRFPTSLLANRRIQERLREAGLRPVQVAEVTA